MVCEKCEKKLSKVIVPDKWKEGASNTTDGGGRKINENKLLSKKKRWTPYGNTKCIICKQQVHQDAKYCHTCAYSKGISAPKPNAASHSLVEYLDIQYFSISSAVLPGILPAIRDHLHKIVRFVKAQKRLIKRD
ncbi:hypothetical protein L484_012905 [Morus notabilis]|uniref:Cysteine-rich PDZ-binding protein n=1 Tax=Morus notabilis TaxID=981085 RepID=W9RFQ3_9ROSA|nr:hypothetical protein L484_012905 [Morus notabilis]